MRMDKSVPRVTVCHFLAEPRDAKNDPSYIFVHPYLTLMSDSYILPGPRGNKVIKNICWVME